MILIPLDISVKDLAEVMKKQLLFPFKRYGALGLLIIQAIVFIFKIILYAYLAVLFVCGLPAWPFIVAFINRKEHPKMCKAIVWLWSIIWALVALIYYLDNRA